MYIGFLVIRISIIERLDLWPRFHLGFFNVLNIFKLIEYYYIFLSFEY